MKKKLIILVIGIIIFSCKMTTEKGNDGIMNHFNVLSQNDKIDYFNSLNNRDKFLILEVYLKGKCFELPIVDVIKFLPDGTILIDWMYDNPNANGLIYASGDKEPFIEYIPFLWKVNNKSLVIMKTDQYQEFKNARNKENLIFNFNNEEVVVYDKVFISIFQNKLYFTLKNNQQEISFLEGSCDKWPVMKGVVN